MSLTYIDFLFLSSQVFIFDLISLNHLAGSYSHQIFFHKFSLYSFLFTWFSNVMFGTLELVEGLGSLNCGYGVNSVVLSRYGNYAGKFFVVTQERMN